MTIERREQWHENGQLEAKCVYEHDKLHGLYEYWHDNGQLSSSITYINGVQQDDK